MSTDSTELTFVRCPSCRSLVPAVSTRCRMCGATLDAAVKPEEEPKRSGRVRQRTMSQPHSQLSATASQIRQDLGGQEPEETLEGAEEPVAEVDIGDDNPLGQYLQEDEVEVIGTGGEEEFDDAFADDITAEPVEVAAPRVAAEPTKPSPSAIEEPKSKVTVESGPRQMGKPSSLSFSKGKEEAPQRAADRPGQRPSHDARGGRDRDRQQAEPRRENEQRRDRDPRRDRSQRDSFSGGRENREEERQSHDRRGDARPQERSQEHPVSHSQKGPAAMQTSSKNRLVGWLVSFDEARGSAVELREGKFFVTGSSLKNTDLVIPSKNVSTPHALITVSASQGVRIQDLMSESGLFVRRRQKSDFQREDGTITVSHGDSVKFGDAEYNIALIDAGS